MESPHMYDNSSDCNKRANNFGNISLIPRGTAINGLEDYPDIGLESNCEEISVDLNNINIDSSFNEENLSQDLQSLNVDKNLGPRGLGAIPSTLDIYSAPLAYMPQPVHHGSQFDRYERIPIKEEPSERSPDHTAHEYNSCSKYSINNAYNTNTSNNMPYSTMNSSQGVDLLNSSIKSPGSVLRNKVVGKSDKSTDEYRRRRERNNIAVRKSREKAKERSRQTEEKVKSLSRDNDKLMRKCEILSKEVTALRQLFSNLNLQYLPETVQRDFRRQMELLHHPNQHHLPGM